MTPQNLHARCVFFVQDTPRALEFYTRTLGFTLDWTYDEKGRPYVIQVSLLGMEIIINQIETPTDDRAGHGRLFVGLDEPQTAAVLKHFQGKGVSPGYTHWGEPTMVVSDLDNNELYFWLCDSERAKHENYR
jgi:catechol 2,3-dioxygenase-like lactoylglutathione lyase family enzyme